MVAFYLDSAERSEVVSLLKTGLFAGVTTNPAILDKAGLGSDDIPDVIGWALEAGARRVFAQVWGDDVSELVDRGRGLRDLSDRVVVKVAYSEAGVVAARQLAQEGEVLLTGVHAAWQVVPALAAHASYVAPFIARMDAAGRDGLEETLAVQRAVEGAGAPLRVLAGSVRTPAQILALVQAGVHGVTFGPSVWQTFFADSVTADAVALFERLAGEPAGVRGAA